MDVEYSAKFLKSADRLPKKLIALADTKEILFKQSPYHPSLHTHQLHGKDKGAWAFWINQKHRIKFIFISPQKVLFLDVGTHDIYE
jgi:mRNA-degrading endonuclease YafQ of YafQ-DinJ toxin-antitoxin module